MSTSNASRVCTRWICQRNPVSLSRNLVSWLTSNRPHGQSSSASSRHSIEGRSRWLVGSFIMMGYGCRTMPMPSRSFLNSPGLGSTLSNNAAGREPGRLTTVIMLPGIRKGCRRTSSNIAREDRRSISWGRYVLRSGGKSIDSTMRRINVLLPDPFAPVNAMRSRGIMIKSGCCSIRPLPGARDVPDNNSLTYLEGNQYC